MSRKKKAATEAAFSDLKMIQAISRTMTRTGEIQERRGPHSLNADSRKQDIYRIMHENHRMLGAIENTEASIVTKDLVREHDQKKKYIINASHTTRLSGEYDNDISRFQREDQVRMEASQRRTKLRMMASNSGENNNQDKMLMDASQRSLQPQKSAPARSVSLPALRNVTPSREWTPVMVAGKPDPPQATTHSQSGVVAGRRSQRPSNQTIPAEQLQEVKKKSTDTTARLVRFASKEKKVSTMRLKRDSSPHPAKGIPTFSMPPNTSKTRESPVGTSNDKQFMNEASPTDVFETINSPGDMDNVANDVGIDDIANGSVVESTNKDPLVNTNFDPTPTSLENGNTFANENIPKAAEELFPTVTPPNDPTEAETHVPIEHKVEENLGRYSAVEEYEEEQDTATLFHHIPEEPAADAQNVVEKNQLVGLPQPAKEEDDEEEYDGDFENDFEDDFVDESGKNATLDDFEESAKDDVVDKSGKIASFDDFEESATFEDSTG